MKHKHYDMIVAWAEGEQIQFESKLGEWRDIAYPVWDNEVKYRVKPEPKPDVVRERCVAAWTGISTNLCPNLRLTFDGETGELKSAEVLK